MVLREQFICHIDKIRDYDNFQQQIDSLTGSVRGMNSNQSGMVELDIYPIVVEMLRTLDDCLDTPYVNILDWTMSRKVDPVMQKSGYAEYTVRLIETWATEFEYGTQAKEIYDLDAGVKIYLQTTDDLYEYLFLNLLPHKT